MLDIIDAPPLHVPIYPVPTHLAETLHAYTLRRDSPNRRIKDLIDVALIASELSVDASSLREAFATTVTFRSTHGVPAVLPAPPVSWAATYPGVRDAQSRPWATIDEVHAEAARFLDPILASGGGTWDPRPRAWGEAGGAAS